MNIGNRIRKIRKFRNMTLKQLGILCGFSENTADVRIRQYESNYRVPKEDIITKISSVLDVNPLAISSPNNDSLEGIMYGLFEIEDNLKVKISMIKSINDSGEEVEKVALVFDDGICKQLAIEWFSKKEELEKGIITEDEYLEWKYNYNITERY